MMKEKRMWRLIKFLFTGSWYVHNWETKEERDRYYNDGHNSRYRIGKSVYLRCKECGVWKRQDLV